MYRLRPAIFTMQSHHHWLRVCASCAYPNKSIKLMVRNARAPHERSTNKARNDYMTKYGITDCFFWRLFIQRSAAAAQGFPFSSAICIRTCVGGLNEQWRRRSGLGALTASSVYDSYTRSKGLNRARIYKQGLGSFIPRNYTRWSCLCTVFSSIFILFIRILKMCDDATARVAKQEFNVGGNISVRTVHAVLLFSARSYILRIYILYIHTYTIYSTHHHKPPPLHAIYALLFYIYVGSKFVHQLRRRRLP